MLDNMSESIFIRERDTLGEISGQLQIENRKKCGI